MSSRCRWSRSRSSGTSELALADAEVTRALTLRHTLSCCLEMPRRDAESAFGGEMSAEERIAALRTHRPTKKLGEAYCYSSVLVAVGGYALGRAYAQEEPLGDAYQRAMRECVLEPLGMATTTFDLAEVAGAEHAAAHPRDLDGVPVAYPPAMLGWARSTAPAGAAWSSAADPARVLQLEPGTGELGCRRVISAAALLARRAPQVAISENASYGIGLVIDREHGVRSAIAARIVEPDPPWAHPLVGRWRAPGLPVFELRRDDRGRLVLDRGIWQVVLAGARTAAGAPALLSVGAPLLGLELARRGEGASTELVASVSGLEPIVFRRADG